MMRAKGRYRNQTLELDQPLALAEGTEVEIAIHLAEAEEVQGSEPQEWAELGMQRLEAEWENPEDALYDDWKKLYDV
jgi:hypothetical protein